MSLPRTAWLVTARLLPWDTHVETRISVNAACVVSPPTTNAEAASDVDPK